MTLIQAEHLEKHYGSGEGKVTALAGVNFCIETGEFVAVMGESGAGKSTLLSILGAMNSPSQGRYVVDDMDVYQLTGDQRADFRREYLGFVFQSFHLVSYLTVLENTMLPLTTVRATKREKVEMALEALDWVGIKDKAGRLPGEISGGEKERVSIARAIANNPPVLLADEPTGNLDSKNTREVMELLRRINRNGTTIVMVTHSDVCATYAERVLTMADGHLMERRIVPGRPVSASAAIEKRTIAA